jgi:hypothetical protein
MGSPEKHISIRMQEKPVSIKGKIKEIFMEYTAGPHLLGKDP